MSFYPQPNKYQCGPFALKYALVMLGVFASEKSIGRKAGSSWWYGTDEIGLAKAAKYYNCRLKYFRREVGADGVKALMQHLKKGYPCILSVDNWGHWLTVTNWQQGKFILIDSSKDKVINIYSAKQLINRWKFIDPDDEFKSFDGYAVMPNFKTRTRAKFTLAKASYVMQKKNSDLAKHWDTYFNDLIAICKPRTATSIHTISFGEFLRRYEKMIIQEVAYWHGNPSYSELKKIIDKMEFIANVYNLVIYIDEHKKALVDITSLLMMYTCGKYGMEKIYI
jgi:ABC-type bacteriocin/lantibiotic exporter with double-glycine peptidase domain